MPSHQTVCDTVKTIIAFLVSSRDAMHDRHPSEYRNCAAQQVVMLQQTLRGVTPDHTDAANAIDTLRQSTVFTDMERHTLIDALTTRMGQLTSIEAGRTVRYTTALGQACPYFFNLCTAAFWAGVMDQTNTIMYAMELAVTMALEIDLRHPREATLGIMLSTIICARHEQHKYDAAWYYDKINALRVIVMQRRAAMPDCAVTLLTRYPDLSLIHI